MSHPACPECTMEEVIAHPDKWECVTCGFEWPKDEVPEGPRIVKDAHGTVLADGDCVVLIKDLKLGGSSVLKGDPSRSRSSWSTGITKSPARWMG